MVQDRNWKNIQKHHVNILMHNKRITKRIEQAKEKLLNDHCEIINSGLWKDTSKTDIDT